MKKLIFLSIAFLALAFALSAQTPTRLFDVRTGSTTSTTIIYKDEASKRAVIDDLAAQYGYQATVLNPNKSGEMIANPITKEQFFNARLSAYLSEVVVASRIRAATESAARTAKAAAEAEVPPQ